ncbi:MAG: CoA transferase [Naasia sp.]|nr:CoA transferase [Naasia sp.]
MTWADDRTVPMTGAAARPLAGIRVVEFAALGPVEYAAMHLADLGAAVTLVRRPGDGPRTNVMLRGRAHVQLDLKSPDGRAAALDLLRDADVLLEGLRPGVMERLGLGPADAAAVNPRIVYGRMTGWGQSGPLAAKAGHDINYIAESGALSLNRRPGEAPVVPGNMLGDNGGGAMFLVTGVLAALIERARTGAGTVVDAAIVDGAASLTQAVRGFRSEGDATGEAMLAAELPWYDVYECADGGHVAVGAVEPQFYAELLRGLGIDDPPSREDQGNRETLRTLFRERFGTRSRDEWTEIFAGLDACVSPVYDMDETLASPHLTARGTWLATTDGPSAAPAPRFVPLPTRAPAAAPDEKEL